MKKIGLLAAMTAAVAISGHAQAQVADAPMDNNAPSVTTDKASCSGDKSNCSGDSGSTTSNDTEKCVPVVNGKNIVKANKGTCATGKHSCSGQNPANEADAWVNVPKGVCNRIKSGDFSDVPDSVKANLDLGVSTPATPAAPVAAPVAPSVPQQAAGPGTVADSADDTSSATSDSWWNTFKSWFGM